MERGAHGHHQHGHRQDADAGDPDKRIEHGFRVVTSRFPNQKEKTVLYRLLKERLGIYGKDTQASKTLLSVGESKKNSNLPESELAAWTTVARALLNLSETISKN